MWFKTLILIISLINTTSSTESCSDDEVLIETSIGKIKGICSIIDADSEKKKLYTWLSIPYAEPPIGNNRFKAPEPKKNLSETLNANKVANSCMQLINMTLSEDLRFSRPYDLAKNSTSKISEDCLYLNIYAPADSNFMVKKKPILVIIHGGDGTTGSGSLDIQEPSIFVTMTNTIVVTFNFRLEIFGFLKLDDEEYQGNQGFLDQHLALKWIHENAEKYGGDDTKITLMGYGSGSRFVGLHLIYQPSFVFFRNVILQSGSPVNLADNLLSKSASKKRTDHFIQKYYNQCYSDNKNECLRKVDAFNLTLNSRKFLIEEMSKNSLLTASKIQTLFQPIVDGKIFKESPIRAFRLGDYKKCKFIIGFNSNDGASKIPLKYGFRHSKQEVNFEGFVRFLKRYYAFYPIYPMHKNLDSFHNIVIQTYTNFTMETYKKNSKNHKSNYFSDLKNMLTDEEFACPTFKLLDHITDDNEVFMYIYDYRIDTSKYPAWYGVVNGDELASVFGQPFKTLNYNMVSYNPWLVTDKLKFTEDDKTISKNIMKKWANFVHFNNPNREKYEPLWPLFELNSGKEKLYMSFSQSGTKVMKLHDQKRCETWNKKIPFIMTRRRM